MQSSCLARSKKELHAFFKVSSSELCLVQAIFATVCRCSLSALEVMQGKLRSFQIITNLYIIMYIHNL